MILTIIIAFIFMHINAPIYMWVLLALYLVLKMKKAATEIKRFASLAIGLLICTAADAQIIRAEPFYVSPEEPVAANLLLDSFPGAAVAYSLRKLDKDYTGSAIRVRRSSDNTEQDIGFVNNYLDTASMKTFVGNNNGFVVTWYNQADSAGVFGVRNLKQSVAANQPRIISSGVIDVYTTGTSATVQAIKFDGSNDGLFDDSVYVASSISASYFISTSKLSVATGNQIIASIGQQNMARLQQCSICGAGTSGYVGVGGAAIYASYANNSVVSRINEQVYNGSLTGNSNRFIAYQNNTQNTLTFTGTIPASVSGRGIKIGYDVANDYFSGHINEMIYYSSTQSLNRATIRDNANRFYSIY